MGRRARPPGPLRLDPLVQMVAAPPANGRRSGDRGERPRRFCKAHDAGAAQSEGERGGVQEDRVLTRRASEGSDEADED